MLGIGGTKPVAGQAEEVIACPTSKAYEFIGERFFANYQKWCPQVVELEQLSPQWKAGESAEFSVYLAFVPEPAPGP